MKGTAIIEAVKAGRGTSSPAAFLVAFDAKLRQFGFAVVPLGDMNADAPSNPNSYSRKAAKDIRPTVKNMRGRVLRLLRSSPATCYELEERTGIKHQTLSARMTELSQGHYIEPTGKSRETNSGSLAAVYQLTQSGWGWLSDHED